MDRKEDNRDPHTLPTPHQFQGQLFIPIENDERYKSMNELIDAQIQHRMQTIIHLRNLASTLKSQEFDCAIAKVTGSAVGVSYICTSICKYGLSLEPNLVSRK